ncbi:serine--tRNA ligase [Candidatus Woesearchaeota archaeon]|nr:serine--tRNA ligase [Candidatus Woesearchaeota archaeon]
MLTAKFIRENEKKVKENMAFLGKDASAVDELLKADEEWRKEKKELDELRHERNEVSEAINKAKKEGLDVQSLLRKAKAIPGRVKEKESSVQKKEEQLQKLLAGIPNVAHQDVPQGKDESENKEVKRWGEPRTFRFPVKNHVELAESLGIADFDASANVSGNGFYYLKDDLGHLNQALVQFAIDHLRKKGYTYIEPPLLVRKHVLDAAMDTEGFEQSIYKVTDEEDPLCLIGTAEHAILGMLEGKSIEEQDLPMKVYGYSMCFRQEIGSHGINEKGLWRTHQFNKVEQFIFCLPEQTWDAYEELKRNSEEILQALKLPYRVVEICTGDLAMWKARSHDLEAWRPTTKGYGEVMSLSNCTTYQAEELGIRYVRRDGERGTVHTLNNTALATSRIMVAILENYQEKDGSVTIPESLRPYMDGQERITVKR